MYLVDLLGALLTVLALGFLALGGYLGALRLLGPRADEDRLALAVAALLLATAEAVAIALLLGAAGVLRIHFALALQGALVVALLLDLRLQRPGYDLAAPLVALGRRGWAVAREHWAASLLVAHALAAEAVRGLLRPPLWWDSISYHLVLTATWLRDGDVAPVFGSVPLNYHGYVPANGSLWFWWWMAPSHSELYVNLASIPHWLLVALAVGAVARQLGAERSWPLAAACAALTPTVVRFATAEYVDLFLAGALLGGLFFGLRWLAESRWSDALLFAIGLGLAAGAKVLGIPYVLAAAGAVVLLARGGWARRIPQLAAIAAVTLLLGGYFYLRNVALGADPLALACERTATPPELAGPLTFPRHNSVLDAWPEMVAGGRLLEAFLGTTRAGWVELGVGPQALVLLLAVALLPLLVPAPRRREAWALALVVWALVAFWLTVPFARLRHVYANVRYLIPCVGIGFAGLAAFADRRRLPARAVEVLAVALLVQDLLQLAAEMPLGVRAALAAADFAAVTLLVAPAAARWTARHWRAVAVTGLAIAMAAAPALARFRTADRQRAYSEEFGLRTGSARLFAPGWAWLDAHAGDGSVAVVQAPHNYLVYPAMGPRLERDVRYVNVNDADLPLAVRYPACQPRVDPSPRAWVRNLARQRIRWLHVARYPAVDFPPEAQWADSLPRLFTLRFADATNRIYELQLPRPPSAMPSP